MAFDPNLDKRLFSETKEFETTRITVAVHQYNEGEKKIQVSRIILSRHLMPNKLRQLRVRLVNLAFIPLSGLLPHLLTLTQPRLIYPILKLLLSSLPVPITPLPGLILKMDYLKI